MQKLVQAKFYICIFYIHNIPSFLQRFTLLNLFLKSETHKYLTKIKLQIQVRKEQQKHNVHRNNSKQRIP
jgi:hypothetical protein